MAIEATGIVGTMATTEETGMENIATVMDTTVMDMIVEVMTVVGIVERLRVLASYEQHETKPGLAG